MKFIKIIAWLALVALIVIQFFPITLNESDTVPQSDFMVENQVPATIKNRLQVSCYDCHSNNTDYPWYSKIQPAAWYLEDHIQEGKDELNFNEWAEYSDRRKNSKLRSIISQIEEDKMPLDSYTLIHKDAILSDEDKRVIIDYMTALKDSLE
ncbi:MULTISPECIES: heme-binding domain-containing protein [Flavobacteriaceae]|uniref:Heme-binding domain-containing protein n=3 Tax=Flavobacteriaceae TaxID=49546 RepID=A0A7H9AN40_9FLAO|nr:MULTISPECIES: heme-binding domain-containing protein [Flavobacteriaceae]MCW8979812.1 heme-binding domain-containing protein [Altibacter sp.]MDB4643979.1 heme-binding domain-containing protein [Flavobacteriaceae bacterium]QLG44793.1 heme-binding domain-containing protein [Costertonia aggregata]TDQ32454.1 heme-binding protein [Zeaxanthinibacter enoshimensis]